MAEDGGTLPAPQGKGFLLCTFSGKLLCIPDERAEVPTPGYWKISPDRYPITPATTRAEYARLFRLYKGFIGTEVRKIVLARTADLPLPKGVSPYAIYQAAARNNPGAFTALHHSPEWGTWLFSTPEQLLTGQNGTWHTMALAGTKQNDGTPWDTKNIREQALVADFIRRTVTPIAESVQESAPESLITGNIRHLCTRFCIRMPQEQLLPLLKQLPPTPAVCGAPVEQTRKLILDWPDIDRCCYAGYMGPWQENAVHLYVSLRGMSFFPGVGRLYAGGGLMPDSEEEQEWQETEAKMQAMKQALHCAGYL